MGASSSIAGGYTDARLTTNKMLDELKAAKEPLEACPLSTIITQFKNSQACENARIAFAQATEDQLSKAESLEAARVAYFNTNGIRLYYFRIHQRELNIWLLNSMIHLVTYLVGGLLGECGADHVPEEVREPGMNAQA